VLECVVNVSEGRSGDVLADLAAAAGGALLDLHADPDHHRAVLTLAGEEAPRAVARAAVERIDLRTHAGAHPRIGAVDVVPFVALGATPPDAAVGARDRFARWAADELGLPCFLYGPERSLPDVRRGAFGTLAPDTGPPRPHPTAGAAAVGARPVLVAYNVWLAEPDLAAARRLAAALRGPAVRALGLAVGDAVQVSVNLVDPLAVGPAAVHDRVAAEVAVARAELVGLVPAAVLRAVPRHRWAELDLAEDRTIEARLEAAGLATP
jgi:glutamate formiminotransferase